MKELKSEIQLVAQKKPKCLKPLLQWFKWQKREILSSWDIYVHVCMYLVEKERKAFSNNGIKIRV